MKPNHPKIVFPRGLLALAATAVLCTACSGGTPTVAGVWHVNVQSFSSGSLSPASFDVTITDSAGALKVSMPAITWTGGPDTTINGGHVIRFDTKPTMDTYPTQQADSLMGFGETVTPDSAGFFCGLIDFAGRLSAKHDTLHSASVKVYDDTTRVGGSIVCTNHFSGPISANK